MVNCNNHPKSALQLKSTEMANWRLTVTKPVLKIYILRKSSRTVLSLDLLISIVSEKNNFTNTLPYYKEETL